MGRQQQHGIGVHTAGEQVHAQERPDLKVEGSVGLLDKALFKRRLIPTGCVDDRAVRRAMRVHPLKRLAVLRTERGAQRRMPIGQGLECVLQRLDVDRRLDADGVDRVVHAARGHLVLQPQRTLPDAQRVIARLGLCVRFLDRQRNRCFTRVADQPGHHLGQLAQAGAFQ